MTVEAHPLPFKHQDNTLSAAPAPSPPFLSPHEARRRRRKGRRRRRRRRRRSLVAVGRATRIEPSPVFVFYACSFFPYTIGLFFFVFFKRGRYGEIAVALVGGRAPPTYSDWTTGLGVRGSRWELYFGEASPSRTRLGGGDYESHDAPARRSGRVGSHVGVRARARGKGGDFCAVGGWANGKGRRVCVCVCLFLCVFL